jgi:ATP-dependent exoDNAse (exonuclease V) beta subunit
MDELASLQPQDLNKKAWPTLVSTIHKAKGLEFDNVFVIGINSHRNISQTNIALSWYQHHQFNSAYLTDVNYQLAVDQELKECRMEISNLFYVACTRARKKLFLTTNRRNEQRVAPTSFLALL